jgi:hypothetical protein
MNSLVHFDLQDVVERLQEAGDVIESADRVRQLLAVGAGSEKKIL